MDKQQQAVAGGQEQGRLFRRLSELWGKEGGEEWGQVEREALAGGTCSPGGRSSNTLCDLKAASRRG